MLEKQAQGEGRSLAAYVERILQLHTQPPNWRLKDLQPVKALGKQLIALAQVARKMPAD